MYSLTDLAVENPKSTLPDDEKGCGIGRDELIIAAKKNGTTLSILGER